MWYYNPSSKYLHQIVAKNTVKGGDVALVASYCSSGIDSVDNIIFPGYEKVLITNPSLVHENIIDCTFDVTLVHTKEIAALVKGSKLVRRSDLAGVIMRAQSLLNDYPEISDNNITPEIVSLKKCTSLIQTLIGSEIDKKILEHCTYLKANTEFFHRGEYPHKAISLSFSTNK